MAGQYPAHEGLQYNDGGPHQASYAPEVYRYQEAAPEIAPQGSDRSDVFESHSTDF